jgi:hypothetical protein
MSMSFDMDDVPLQQRQTAGLAQNECYPKMLIDDPTFALLMTDPSAVGNPNNGLWPSTPSANLIGNRSPPFNKRGLLDPYEYLIDAGNESRVPTAEEMQDLADEMVRVNRRDEELRLLLEDARGSLNVGGEVACLDDECATQIRRPWRTESVPEMTAPASVEAAITAPSAHGRPTQTAAALLIPRVELGKPAMTA